MAESSGIKSLHWLMDGQRRRRECEYRNPPTMWNLGLIALLQFVGTVEASIWLSCFSMMLA